MTLTVFVISCKVKLIAHDISQNKRAGKEPFNSATHLWV